MEQKELTLEEKLNKTFMVEFPDLSEFYLDQSNIDQIKTYLKLYDKMSDHNLNFHSNMTEEDKVELKKIFDIATIDATFNALTFELPSPYDKSVIDDHGVNFTSNIDQLTVTILDLSDEYYSDAFSRSIYLLNTGLNDQYNECHDREYYLKYIKTLNLFEYYHRSANLMTAELEKIFGWAQECYFGIDGDHLISGFDVTDGSILLIVPLGSVLTYKFKEGSIVEKDPPYKWILPKLDDGWDAQSTAVFRPYSFYGPNKNHFFDTSAEAKARYESRLHKSWTHIRLD